MDSLENYRILLSVAEHESFTAAARTLRLTTAKVSRAVADVEGEVGAKLLERTTRKVSLTPAGAAFVAQAGPAVEALDAARLLAAGRKTARGFKSLRIASEPAGGLALLQPAFASFVAGQMGANMALDILERPVRPAAEGFDLAFSLKPRGSDLEPSSRLVTELEFALVASATYCAMHNRPQDPEDVLQHTLLVWTAMPVWHLRDGTDVRPKIAHFFNDIRVIIELCIAACGVALVPEPLVEQAIADRQLLRLLNGFEPLPLQFVASWPEGRPASSGALAFMDHLSRHLR